MNVVKFLGAIILVATLVSSCGERKHRRSKAEEVARLETYLDKAITVDSTIIRDSLFKTSTQMYYVSRRDGKGTDSLVYGDQIYYRWECYYLDSTLVTSNLTFANPEMLSLFVGVSGGSHPADIQGFHEGLSLMRNGGKATFFIPSTLAYGGNGKYGIPGYTTLRFEVSITNYIPAVVQ